MVAKASLMTETFSTLLASEGTLSGVYSHMVAKVSLMTETFSTFLADVRLFSSVNSHVVAKASMLTNFFHTVCRCKAFLQCEFSCGG